MQKQTANLKHTWVMVNGRRLHMQTTAHPVACAAPPVVLVHGLIVSGRYLLPTAQLLAADYPVYLPDLPGFGQSAKPPHPLDLDELADTLADWMDAIGLEQAIFLGNSFGCQIVVTFALRHPQRISRAVLVGPTVDVFHRTLFQQAVRLALIFLREPPMMFLIALRDFWDAGLACGLLTARVALRDQIEAKLPLVQVPTLVVRGKRDRLVPQAWAEEVTRLLPLGRLVVLPQGTHTINYTAPRELVQVVRPFLEEVRTSANGAAFAAEPAAMMPSCGTIGAIARSQDQQE